MVDISRVTTEGQVTIPYEFRKKLDIKEGDKIVFVEKDGLLFLGNSNRIVLEDFARSMAGEAEKAGINAEEDITRFVREIRGEIWESKYADNEDVVVEWPEILKPAEFAEKYLGEETA